MTDPSASGPLAGLRIVDLTRVLAGPATTMMLGDLGAEVIKVEKPGAGDDTRGWGPPFLQDDSGHDTSESAYYLSANRNKKSVTIDFHHPEGLAILKKLIASADVVVENYKTGGLEKYGLGYQQLKSQHPRLIYCSITGFGQTGPYKNRPGYDYMIQAISGIMSLTGPAEGAPTKMAIAYADVMTGQNATTAILAALYHREKTGQGQHIDIALLDSQVAALWNIGQSYLVSGAAPQRMGNAHATIVPYEAFEAADGWLVLAVGNDRQFADFCGLAGRGDLAADARFTRNADRVRHRDILVPIVRDIIAGAPRAYWLTELEKRGVPCGPVNTLPEIFADPQVAARGMVQDIRHPAAAQPVRFLANPIKLSATPVTYRLPPPMLGQQTDDILGALGFDEDTRADLRQRAII